jgi:NAD+ kinase
MGPILPLGSAVIALTPIAPFRPRRWRGAILRADTLVKLRVLDPYKRPVSVTADSHEVRDVVEVTIREGVCQPVQLLFDPEHNLDDRILNEQFTT